MIRFVVIGVFLLSFVGRLSAEPALTIKNGILDIRGWNFEEQGLVDLTGNWEVYWDQLILPEEFQTDRMQPAYFQVPNSWEDVHANKMKNGHHGFATFRLTVLTDRKDALALSITNILTNFKVYVNGTLVSSFGHVTSNQIPTGAKRHPILISDSFTGDTLEIVIQVSNNMHTRGGLYRSIYLGPNRLMHNFQRKLVGFELFLFGSILIIGVYNFGNFFFRKNDIASVFFSLFCFLFSVRILFMGTRFAAVMIPNLDFNFTLLAGHISIYLALPIFSTFVYYLYPNEFSKRVLKWIIGLTLIFSISILRFNETAYIVSLLCFEITAILSLCYIGYVIISAIRNHRDGASLILGGVIFLILAAINDTLLDKGFIHTGFYLPLGLLGYILFQTLHLSYRASQHLIRNEELTSQLAQVNATLEQRVKTRTSELKKRNEQLKVEIFDHKKTTEKLAEAKMLSEEANLAKSEFLANMSHELRTPMHGILGFAKFGEDRINKTSRESLLDFFREIRFSGERLLVLLNDLLDLSKLESGKIVYDFARNNLNHVVETILKEMAPLAKEKSIELSFQKSQAPMEAVFDDIKMMQVVRNLISNAIKYSPDHSKVNIQVSNQEDSLSLSVIDQGVGIPEDELEDVFDKFVQSSKTKTAAGGTGLGLPISQKIINDHKGDIWAVNNKNGGATFTFVIPKIQKAKKKLGEMLVEQKLITREELIDLLQSQQKGE